MDDNLRRKINAVTAKRPRTMLDHIVKHGSITTDELKTLYGYSHPPRAARDVRECGIRLTRLMVKGPDGRRMASYSLGADDLTIGSARGRRPLSKALRDALHARDGDHCRLCGSQFPAQALQPDHRVPYEVAGDPRVEDPLAFMQVCGGCNRGKSWSCEHCPNWLWDKLPEACETCFWASPEQYLHIRLEPRRRLGVEWQDDEIEDYEILALAAEARGTELGEYVKQLLRRATSNP